MNLLIIGGTRFVGRAIVQAGLNAGHTITLFNRGKSNPELFPEAEKIAGDRNNQLDLLAGRQWDAVIDTSGYLPQQVGSAAEALKDSVGHFTFISTISIYADFSQAGIDEDSPQQTLPPDAQGEDGFMNSDNYGALKTHCEMALNEVMPGRVCHIRPALVVGPHDPQDLFPYIVWRAAQGGEMLVPGIPERPMQFIDAADLGRFVIAATEQKLTGPYITTGPDYTLTMGDILETAKAVGAADTRFTYVGDGFLPEQGLAPVEETPWWIPESHKGYGLFDNRKAVAAGLRFRPLDQTITETLAWLGDRNQDESWKAGFSAEQEQNYLKLWQSYR